MSTKSGPVMRAITVKQGVRNSSFSEEILNRKSHKEKRRHDVTKQTMMNCIILYQSSPMSSQEDAMLYALKNHKISNSVLLSFFVFLYGGAAAGVISHSIVPRIE
jgi:hypothetical protein